MNSLELTLRCIRGERIPRPPFHPIVMRWAAQHAGVPYRSFACVPATKCAANILCAESVGMDWVTVMSDPYAEAEAFGLQVTYPEDGLPQDRGGHLPDLDAVSRLRPFNPREHARCRCRIAEICEYAQRVGSTHFIVGWVEGPVAEYVDLRGASLAAMDFLDDPHTVGTAMDVIVASAMDFISLQVAAGAHCIGIGDAFCSQIGPTLYRQLAFDREKQLIAHIHQLGALAKLHICGNTTSLLPDMIATGADIIDVDHLVPDMAQFAGLLGSGQVFSGKTDPVAVVQDGTAQGIDEDVGRCLEQAGGRLIVSAGCEITPGTSIANMQALHAAARYR